MTQVPSLVTYSRETPTYREPVALIIAACVAMLTYNATAEEAQNNADAQPTKNNFQRIYSYRGEIPDWNKLLSVDKSGGRYWNEADRLTALSSDGQYLVFTIGRDTRSLNPTKVAVWDFKARQMTHRIEVPCSPASTSRHYRDLTLSPSGLLLGCLSRRSAGSTLHMWDLSTDMEVCSIDLGPREIGNVIFSRDGKFIAGDNGHNLLVWEIPTRKEMPSIESKPLVGWTWDQRSGWRRAGTKAEVLAETGNLSCFATDGKRVLTGHFDGARAVLWDLETGKELRRFRSDGHSDVAYVSDVWLSKDGQRAIVSSTEGTSPSNTTKILVCDTASEGAQVKIAGGRMACVSPDGLRGFLHWKKLPTGELWRAQDSGPPKLIQRGLGILLDLRNGKQLRELTGIDVLATSPERNLVLLGDGDKRWEVWRCGP